MGGDLIALVMDVDDGTADAGFRKPVQRVV
jgi:hypothetical protein